MSGRYDAKDAKGYIGFKGALEVIYFIVVAFAICYVGFLLVPLLWMDAFRESAVALLAFVAGPVAVWAMARLVASPLRMYLFHRLASPLYHR